MCCGGGIWTYHHDHYVTGIWVHFPKSNSLQFSIRPHSCYHLTRLHPMNNKWCRHTKHLSPKKNSLEKFANIYSWKYNYFDIIKLLISLYTLHFKYIVASNNSTGIWIKIGYYWTHWQMCCFMMSIECICVQYQFQRSMTVFPSYFFPNHVRNKDASFYHRTL